MRQTIQLLAALVLICTLQCACLAQPALFDNVTNFELATPVNDVVYDPALDVLYASIPSIAGFPFGNSIAMIDPATGEVTDSIFVGSEPNTLAISADGSHVFVGIDGVEGVRSYQPATGTLSPVVSLNDSVAMDIAVFPGQPSVAVISSDVVNSSASGSLVVFDGLTVASPLNVGFFSASNHIGFASPTTLVGFNDSSTAFTASTFGFNGTALANINSLQNVINRFDIEAEVGPDGLLYFTNGTVIDPATFGQVGSFNTGLSLDEQLVEAVPSDELVYFVGPSDGDVVLSAFDLNRFLQVDSIVLPTSATTPQTRGELVFAGQSRLAFVFKPVQGAGPGGSGTLNIVSGIRTAGSVLLGDCNQDGVVDFLDISPFVSILSVGGFRVEADVNEDGVVNFLDISPFIALLSS